MSFNETTFDNFITLQRGYDLTQDQFIPGPYPVVSSTAIMGFHNKFKARAPGVVIGRSGTLGQVQYLTTDYWPHNTSLYVKDFKGNDPRFVYYFLMNIGTERNGGGCAVPTLNRNHRAILDVRIPDINTQERIASILSAYDELIETNRRQIKLLEEAAQRLYKEWFVDLRFPGWEETKIVDGTPEGWRCERLKDLCNLSNEVTSINNIAKDLPYIGLEHMPRADFCLSNWGNASEVTSNKYIYEEDDIIFGKIRPYFHKIGFALNNGIVSTDSFVIKPNNGMWGVVLMTLFDKAFIEYTYKTCKEGAKMPRADWNQMEKYPIRIPEDDMLAIFEEYIWNITRCVKNLALQNIALTESRDRLLPKLMTGEIEV